jgi:hypothetical protein
MSLEAVVQTMSNRGFTERQAPLLVLVARHSGICVMRQYSTFAGIISGQKTRKFFSQLVERGYASTYDCAHNRAACSTSAIVSSTRPSETQTAGFAERRLCRLRSNV